MKACIIGGGSWGSAFALHLGRQNIPTHLWIREHNIFEHAVKHRENPVFLPGFVFPDSVSFFSDMDKAVNDAKVIFIAVPSRFCREVYEQLVPSLSSEHEIVSLTKGIEKDSLKRMSEVMEEVFNPSFQPRIAALSGPSFSKEVAECHPTAVVIASKELRLSRKIQKVVSNPYFRAYTTEDICGVELAGALKNVIAIATGISDSFQFGSNSMAGLVTRGLAEIARLGMKIGAKMETFAGLAGVGDLVLTCTGQLSRNHYVGYELGKGKSLDEIISGMKMIAEGVSTTLSAHQLALRENVEMPICEQVYKILYENQDPKVAFQELMARELKKEHY